MEGKIKEGADGQEQGDGAVVLKKRQHVTMGMEVLDCPVCYNPLSPPIFQVTSTVALVNARKFSLFFEIL
jgi:E3 ubiquitin-protein ligase SIAH1